jgi:hypothetical protein
MSSNRYNIDKRPCYDITVPNGEDEQRPYYFRLCYCRKCFGDSEKTEQEVNDQGDVIYLDEIKTKHLLTTHDFRSSSHLDYEYKQILEENYYNEEEAYNSLANLTFLYDKNVTDCCHIEIPNDEYPENTTTYTLCTCGSCNGDTHVDTWLNAEQTKKLFEQFDYTEGSKLREQSHFFLKHDSFFGDDDSDAYFTLFEFINKAFTQKTDSKK